MDRSKLLIREERAGDEAAVRSINQAAFGQDAEANIVDALRSTSVALISLVAVLEGKLVGHILFSPVEVEYGPRLAGAMGLGPVAVIPDCQRQSVGSLLIREGLQRCRDAGVSVVFVLGHPDYYPRFGFQPASASGLYYKDPKYDPYFFVLELVPGSTAYLSGEVTFLPQFDEA